jgi:hypothetical protein
MKLWKTKQKNTEEKAIDEYLILGHMIKYNLYLLSKSIIFSSVVNKTNTLADAISLTNEVIGELDLASKESKKDS